MLGGAHFSSGYGSGLRCRPAKHAMIEIISATRMTEDEFWSRSALGISLRRLNKDKRLVPRIAFANRRGLPDVFNERISATEGQDLLVFVHDDVWIDDFFLVDRVIEGLQAFDVVGIAGNLRRVPRQPAWAFVGRNAAGGFVWDERRFLSGAVAHGVTPFGAVSFFGSAPAACELLDGVFLAARRSKLLETGALFDPAFAFHFYDLDFCRTTRAAALRLGTWPIAVTHQSGGAFGSVDWTLQYHAYLEKWRD